MPHQYGIQEIWAKPNLLNLKICYDLYQQYHQQKSTAEETRWRRYMLAS
jgi:hypothetical protein